MEFTDLAIGTKLELEPCGENEKRPEHSLVSEFEWLVDQNAVMVAAPIHEGVIYPLHLGTAMNVYFIKKNGFEYELFAFKATVTAREMQENLALLKLTIGGGIDRVQRRKYYRLGCSIPVRFRVVGSMNDQANENIPFRSTIASNLSGGGLCLLLEEKMEVGELIECEISPEENKVIKFYGKVIRYQKSELDTKLKYEAGIVYIKINNNDREAVVKFIFNEQRKLRKKGLI